jgi:septal ring factor EnvC (AmiA/AmiB activator)
MRKHSLVSLAIAIVLGLSLSACQDPFGSKARQENEQLKTQLSSAQQDNSQLRAQLAQVTSSRDALQKENDALKTENEGLKAEHPAAKHRGSTKK